MDLAPLYSIVWVFRVFTGIAFRISKFSGLSITGVYFRNAHLVHQNWYRMNFTPICMVEGHGIFFFILQQFLNIWI
jgi:hypothetical protein